MAILDDTAQMWRDALGIALGDLYHWIGAAVAGALAAILDGEDFLKAQIARFREGRDIALSRLSQMDGVSCVPPAAAFYAFFQIDGVTDDVAFAQRLAEEAKVGIAPGSAFDPGLENWFRICFAKEPSLLEEAFDRMGRFMKTR